MTTGINVGAAQSGIKSLTRDLADLRRQVQGVNGDLSKLPGNIRAEVEAAQSAFDTFSKTRMGRGLAERANSTGGLSQPLAPGGAPAHYIWQPDRLSTAPGGGQRMINRSAQALGINPGQPQQRGGGTVYNSPIGPAPPSTNYGAPIGPPMPPQTPPGGAGGGGAGGLMGGMGAAARFILPLLGIGGVASTLYSGFKSAQQYTPQVDGLLRSLDDVRKNFDDLDGYLRKFGDGLQMSNEESLRFASIYAHAGNFSDQAQLSGQGRVAAGFARAYGLNPDSAAGGFGTMQYHGIGGNNGAREIAMIVAQTVSSSGMNARADEVLGAIASFAQSAATQLLDNPTAGTQKYAALYSGMMQANPGLGGAGSAGILGQADSAFQHGGGYGEASKVFLWRALGENDPYQFRSDLEGGLFQNGNFGKVMGGLDQYTSGMGANQANDARANVLGLTMRQAAAMQRMWELQKHGDIKDAGDFSGQLGKWGIDPNETTPDSIQNLADIYNNKDLGGMSKRLMENATYSQAQRINQATPDTLQGILAQIAGEQSRPQNAGTETMNYMAKMNDSLLHIGLDVNAIARVIAYPIAAVGEAIHTAFHPSLWGDVPANSTAQGSLLNWGFPVPGTENGPASAGNPDYQGIIDAIRTGFSGVIRPTAPAPHGGAQSGPTGFAFPFAFRPPT